MSRRRDGHRRQVPGQPTQDRRTSGQARAAREPVDLETTRVLVEEVLRTALALEDVMVSLLDDLPAGAFPDEDPGLVLLEMVVGSIHPAAVAAGAHECRVATALVGAIRERVIEDLRVAADLALRRERAEGEEPGETDETGRRS
jgi:hypothetical protein